MKFKCNQMMHSYKFYFFLRDQSLKKWVKYLKNINNQQAFLLIHWDFPTIDKNRNV